jgi:hypothetical protein
MRINVFGRIVEVIRSGERWKVFYLGNEGKKRPASDIHIPPEVREEGIEEYLADLCHEWARPNRNDVKRLD